MIQITIKKNYQNNVTAIHVSGHARYAPVGKDIVCAAVSTLLQVVGYTLAERDDGMVKLDFDTSGLGTVDITNPSRESYLITGVFENGARMLAEQYPDHVALKVS